MCGALPGKRISYMGLFAKYAQPPGRSYSQYTYKPQWNYYQEDDNDLEIKFDATNRLYQTGACAA